MSSTPSVNYHISHFLSQNGQENYVLSLFKARPIQFKDRRRKRNIQLSTRRSIYYYVIFILPLLRSYATMYIDKRALFEERKWRTVDSNQYPMDKSLNQKSLRSRLSYFGWNKAFKYASKFATKHMNCANYNLFHLTKCGIFKTDKLVNHCKWIRIDMLTFQKSAIQVSNSVFIVGNWIFQLRSTCCLLLNIYNIQKENILILSSMEDNINP